MPSAMMIDPLAQLVRSAATAEGKHLVPLVETRYAVALDAGLAVVETLRRYRNVERESIEATLTFPLPVHATLYALEARIDGRLLRAAARRRKQARADYEDAIERGKSAVLHEELLRGIHMLSVAHLPPGGEIEVTARWVASLALAGGRGHLRIPQSVGEVYGCSGLPDSDELIHGGETRSAALTVACDNGTVTLRGGALVEGRALVPTDAPIDLEVTGWSSRPLAGRAADGRGVSVVARPAPAGDRAVDAAVLIDRSGSMGSRCSGEAGAAATKHGAVIAGLEATASQLADGDAVDLWQFDDAVDRVGSTADRNGGSVASRLLALTGRLAQPNGGTEIGKALAAVLAGSTRRDVLLITDGKSHALDVQALARAGRRIAVLLVGEDSLEANVGHLAALTGGEIFVAAGTDIGIALQAALAALRAPRCSPAAAPDATRRIETVRAGATLAAEWQDAAPTVTEGVIAPRAVAAFAAALTLPALAEEAAAALAEAESLVTHLTSLVLVDEAGATQEGLPATRKIALPSPRVVADAFAAPAAMRVAMSAGGAAEKRRRFAAPPPAEDALRPLARPKMAPTPAGGSIDWGRSPRALRRGDLSGVTPSLAAAILQAAAAPAIVAAATRIGLQPVVLVLALLAQAQAGSDRAAARFAKALLGGLAPDEIERLGAGLRALSC